MGISLVIGVGAYGVVQSDPKDAISGKYSRMNLRKDEPALMICKPRGEGDYRDWETDGK